MMNLKMISLRISLMSLKNTPRCSLLTDTSPTVWKKNLQKIWGLGTTIVFSGETKLPKLL